MKWDKKALETAVRFLKEEGCIHRAISRLEMEYEEDNISVDALGKAFSRHGYHTPSHYAEQSENAPEQGEPTDMEFEENWLINDEKSRHEFLWRGMDIKLTFGEMETAIALYSNVPPGKGMTAGEVAQYFFHEGHEWASEEFFKWMFSKIGFTKKKFPMAPHQVFHNREAIIRSAYNRSDAIVKGTEYKGIIKEQERQIETLRGQLKNITRMISATGKALEEAEVIKVDFRSKKVVGNRHILVAPLSDLHNGKKVEDQPYAKPQNVFNQEVFWERVERYCRLVKQMGRQRRGYYDRIHIAGLGDYFEALLMNMREGQFITADSYGGAQYKAIKDAICLIIETYVEAFGCPVFALIQGGNHDRLSEDKAPGDEEVLAFQLAENISDYFRFEDRVQVEFGAAVASIMLENGVNLISTHGHLRKLKSEKDFATFIQIHGHPEASRYLIIQGHYHCFKVLTGYNWRAVWNSSFCGNDGYNLNKLNTGAPPEAVFLDVCENHDQLVGPFNLNFDLEDELSVGVVA